MNFMSIMCCSHFHSLLISIQYLMYLILLNVRQIVSILFSDLFKYLQNVLINGKEKFFLSIFFLCVPPPNMVWVNWCCVHTQYSIESLQIIHTYTTSSCLWWCWGHKWAQLFEKRIFFRKKFFFFVHNIHEVLPIMHAIACLKNNFHDLHFLPFSRHLMSNITTKIELM